jgi:predicted ATPase/DNA-binding SARP family transcriptional activator
VWPARAALALFFRGLRASVSGAVGTPASFSILGPIEWVVDGRSVPIGGPRHRAALAVLLLRANTVVPADVLVDELWPGDPPASAGNALQGYISQLRKVLAKEANGLGAKRLQTQAPGYRLELAEEELDLHRFVRLVERGRASLANGDPETASDLFRDALDLWSGEPLAEAEGLLLTAERLRLEESRLSAIEDRFAADLACGRAAELVAELRALAEQHPLRERLSGHLMSALYLAGRQADALDVYWKLRLALRDEIGIDPGVELQRLQQAILRQDPSLDPTLARPRARSPVGIPAPASPIVGRDEELAALAELLTDLGTRLVTVTGPGGIGKTALALEAARRIADDFVDGAVLAPLDSLRETALVAPALCQALQIRVPESKDALEALRDHVAGRRLLLLLDNFEQLLSATGVVSDLVAGSPALTVLATSRAPLGLAAEREFRLGPLAIPADAKYSAADLEDVASVVLFVERAKAARRDFELTDTNAESVGRLCARLEGVPLALELAAARMKLMTPAALLERLDGRLTALSAKRRGAPSRHETLRATLDWSYELLDQPARLLLARLAICVDGFTLDAAAEVGGAAPETVIDEVEALVDHSLVVPVDGNEPRFRMLETVREYAADRLDQSEEAPATAQAHLAHFLALAEEAEPELMGPAQREWLERLEREHGNLRAAFDFAVQAGDGDRALRLACALRRFLRMQGHLAEGRRIFAAALALPTDSAPELRATALNGLGTLAGEQGEFVAAKAAFEDALELVADDSSPLAASVRANLGNIALFEGDRDAARSHYEQALAVWRQHGDVRRVSVALENLGCVALAEERLDEAAALLAEGEKLARAGSSEWNLAATLAARARVLVLQDDLGEALELQRESFEIACALDEDHPLADSFDILAGIAAVSGDHDHAATVAGASDALWHRTGARRPPDQEAWRTRALAPTRRGLGAERFAELYARGAALQREAAIGYARAAEASVERASGGRRSLNAAGRF